MAHGKNEPNQKLNESSWQRHRGGRCKIVPRLSEYRVLPMLHSHLQHELNRLSEDQKLRVARHRCETYFTRHATKVICPCCCPNEKLATKTKAVHPHRSSSSHLATPDCTPYLAASLCFHASAAMPQASLGRCSAFLAYIQAVRDFPLLITSKSQ